VALVAALVAALAEVRMPVRVAGKAPKVWREGVTTVAELKEVKAMAVEITVAMLATMVGAAMVEMVAVAGEGATVAGTVAVEREARGHIHRLVCRRQWWWWQRRQRRWKWCGSGVVLVVWCWCWWRQWRWRW
jgi:hypothetical protein